MSKKCDLCQKVFEFPYLLERHKNRKKPCNIIFNLNNYTKELYEELFTGVFGCFEIHFEMRPNKI